MGADFDKCLLFPATDQKCCSHRTEKKDDRHNEPLARTVLVGGIRMSIGVYQQNRSAQALPHCPWNPALRQPVGPGLE